MKIIFDTSVLTATAGWRGVTVLARAEKISEKRARVVEVLEIDGESPGYGMSRTGANRQRYNGHGVAKRLEGNIKNLSSCTIAED